MSAYSFSFVSSFLLLGWLATDALGGNAPLVLSLERSKHSVAADARSNRRSATPITQIIDNIVRPTARMSEAIVAYQLFTATSQPVLCQRHRWYTRSDLAVICRLRHRRHLVKYLQFLVL